MIDPKLKTVKKSVGFKKTASDIKAEKTNKGMASGVVISKEDMKKNAKDFEYLKRKNGGAVKKAKTGGSFPDLNKDGKVTKADILKGRGVIAKKGVAIKKAQMGRLIKKGIEKAVPKIETTTIKNAVKSAGREDLKSKMKLWDKDLAKKKNGGSMKKCKYGCK